MASGTTGSLVRRNRNYVGTISCGRIPLHASTWYYQLQSR